MDSGNSETHPPPRSDSQIVPEGSSAVSGRHQAARTFPGARNREPDRAGAHWKTIEPLLLDLAAELALERVELDIRSIAWELDYVSVPVRIRLSLFGSALAIVESVKVARVRAYCLMDRGIYRAGDTIQAEGVTLTILRIEKDKITLGAGKYSRDFLLR
jgi:hypothetical protein